MDILPFGKPQAPLDAGHAGHPGRTVGLPPSEYPGHSAMSTRHGLVRLYLTILWPVLAGGVAVLLYSAIAG